MTRKRNSKHTPPLSDKELAEFDKEFVVDTFKPLSAKDRARWERARQKGEPVICVHLEQDLLDRVDSLAKSMKISREKLIKRGIKAVLAAGNQ